MALRSQFSILSLSDYDVYSNWFNAYFNLVKRLRYLIVTVWVGIAIWGIATGFGYIAGAKDEMKAPAGSRAALDELSFQNHFAKQANTVQSIVFIECITPNCSLGCSPQSCAKPGRCKTSYNPEVARFSLKLRDEISAYDKEHKLELFNETYGYYLFDGTALDPLKCQFISEDTRKSFIIFGSSSSVKSDIRYAFVKEMLQEILPELNPDKKSYRIGYTGIDPIVRDGSGAAIRQSEMIDAVTMPFAFALLALMVRSWRLLFLSLLNMGIALAASFGCLNLITNIIQKPPLTTTATFVEALILGFSVDYSLFLLRRYRDECKAGRHPEIATKIMLSQAGHSVLMSSLTIICVFAGFIFLRSTDLLVQGMACVVAVGFCLMVNMTNTPAVLLMFPHFFSTFTAKGTACCTRKAETENVEGSSPGSESNDASESLLENEYAMPNHSQDDDDEGAFLHHLTSPTAIVNKTRGGPYKGWFFKLMSTITKWPYNVITLCLLYILILPIAYQALRVRRNQNLLNAIPRSSQATVTYQKLFESFPGGTLQPIYVMVEEPKGILDKHKGPKLFEELVTLTREIAKATNISVSNMNSIAYADGKKVTYQRAKALLNEKSLLCIVSEGFGANLCKLYQFAWKQLVNDDETATLIDITVPFSPFENRIETFILQVNAVLNKYDKSRERLHICGAIVGFVEDMRISFGEFPLLILVTCIVVFSLLGVMLQSAFVVVRLTLTVILPLAGVFGFAVLVYQDGILDWTHIPQVTSHPDGFYWYIPLMTFTMCIGLALDYDVFVISRIREHRHAGYQIRAAIVKSVWEINSTVVAAGLIMALAFGGLLLCDSAAINQMSWILTTSVLFDTFIVQMIAVPAIMSLADNLSWWPYRVPTENLITLEDEVKRRERDLSRMGNSDRILNIQ